MVSILAILGIMSGMVNGHNAMQFVYQVGPRGNQSLRQSLLHMGFVNDYLAVYVYAKTMNQHLFVTVHFSCRQKYGEWREAHCTLHRVHQAWAEEGKQRFRNCIQILLNIMMCSTCPNICPIQGQIPVHTPPLRELKYSADKSATPPTPYSPSPLMPLILSLIKRNFKSI